MRTLLRIICTVAFIAFMSHAVSGLVVMPAEPSDEVVPLEPLALDSDLVVVGKLVDDSGAQNFGLKLPGDSKERIWELQLCKVEVSKVLFDRKSATTQPGNDKAVAAKTEISILTPTRMPPREIGGTGVHPTIQMAMPAEMQKDSSYVFFLKVMEGKAEYYLLPTYRQDADEKTVERATKAVKFDSWAWGKETNSLQLCLLLPEIKLIGFDAQKGLGSIGTTGCIAIRNNGKEAVRIGLKSAKVTVSAVDDKGKEISQNVFEGVTYEKEIKPGEVTLLRSSERSTAVGLFLPGVSVGKWTFSAKLSLEPSSKAGAWSGKVESAGISRQVTVEK